MANGIVVLTRDTRAFIRIAADRSRLAQASGSFPKGTELILGDPIDLFYDHRTQKAREVLSTDYEFHYYVLVEELAILERVK